MTEASFPVDIKHPEVIAFAKAMDEVLCKNDHKGGWYGCSTEYLQARLVEEMGEYFALVAKRHDGFRMNYDEYVEKSNKELIDQANFIMMLWDSQNRS